MDPEEFGPLSDRGSVLSRTVRATTSGFVAGSFWGAVLATWHDVPAVERNVALPALKKTLKVMGTYGLTYAAVAGVYGFSDAMAETLRRKKDLWNGVIGGLAAGPVVGLKVQSVKAGVGASAAFAAVSALLDITGQTTRTPTGREYLPYPVGDAAKERS